MNKLTPFITIFFIFGLSGCSNFEPKETGLVDGRLRPCPNAPKCVSSYENEGIHAIAPLIYDSTQEQAYAKLIDIINSIDNSKIVVQQDNYIHAEFKVTIFNWIDDVEFIFEEDGRTINFSSSASAKFGYWDWGENRRRMKFILEEFIKN